jgi:hypothetical protein
MGGNLQQFQLDQGAWRLQLSLLSGRWLMTTRTLGAAVGFLLVVLFFAGVAIEKTRAESAPRLTLASGR